MAPEGSSNLSFEVNSKKRVLHDVLKIFTEIFKHLKEIS